MRKAGLLLLMPFLALWGCDNSDENKLENVLHYDGEMYVLSANGSYISDFGSETIADKEFHNYKFTLSDGTGYDEDGPESASIIVMLDLYSLSEDGFKTGTYNFSNEEEPGANFLHMLSGLVLDEDTVLVNGGNLAINKSGNLWTVDYELELENDKTAEGVFSAILDVVDMTE